MQIWEAVAVLLAGVAAGGINSAVGSGTLITFPALLALGYPPVVANISNNVGLVLGNLAGAVGYRQEVAPARQAVRVLLPCSAVGGAAGALLLLALPSEAFEAIVPVLIALALALVVAQPWLSRRLGSSGDAATHPVGPAAAVGTTLAGLYGGYFGAAQGVLLVGLFGWVLTDSVQRANGIKNVLVTVVNALAALVFVLVAPDRVDWAVVALIAAGSIAGGFAGAALARRLPPWALRGAIVVIGTVAIVRLLAG